MSFSFCFTTEIKHPESDATATGVNVAQLGSKLKRPLQMEDFFSYVILHYKIRVTSLVFLFVLSSECRCAVIFCE